MNSQKAERQAPLPTPNFSRKIKIEEIQKKCKITQVKIMYKKFCVFRLNTKGLNILLNRNIKICFEYPCSPSWTQNAE